jgi:helix-turn-helix protein
MRRRDGHRSSESDGTCRCDCARPTRLICGAEVHPLRRGQRRQGCLPTLYAKETRASPRGSHLARHACETGGKLRETIAEKGWTYAQAAECLGVSQSRASDLVSAKYDKFSLDMLVTLATRAGWHLELAVA